MWFAFFQFWCKHAIQFRQSQICNTYLFKLVSATSWRAVFQRFINFCFVLFFDFLFLAISAWNLLVLHRLIWNKVSITFTSLCQSEKHGKSIVCTWEFLVVDNVLHEMTMVNLMVFSSKTKSKESRLLGLYANILMWHLLLLAACWKSFCAAENIFFELYAQTCQFPRARNR